MIEFILAIAFVISLISFVAFVGFAVAYIMHNEEYEWYNEFTKDEKAIYGLACLVLTLFSWMWPLLILLCLFYFVWVLVRQIISTRKDNKDA